MKGLDLSAPFRQLVERRLWPVALLLLAGLAAVPVLLAKDGEGPAVPVTAVPADVAPPASTQPVVSVADAGKVERSRKVLGARKDPFRPARAPRAKKADTGGSQVVTSTSAAPAAGGGEASPSTGGSSAPVLKAPVTAPVAPKTEASYSLFAPVVRFGPVEDTELPKMTLMRLAGLPSVKDPVVLYLGLMEDRRTAVFLVDEKATVHGDGKCFPSAEDCRTVRLKTGETAVFDYAAADGTVVHRRLTLVRVAKATTTDAAVARRWRLATAKGGRDALRERLSRVAGHRYDQPTGTVQSTDAE